MKTLEERHKDAENTVKQAQLEVGFRKKQLDELGPKRQEYEDLSLKKFGVSVKKVNDFLDTQSEKATSLIERLEQLLEEARLEQELEKAKQVT